MEWHIVTGSKGGVGKTLLSLLLLIHCLVDDEKRKKGSTLILDLNGMNTDSSALILYRNKIGVKETTIPLETSEKLYHQGGDILKLQTINEYIDKEEKKYVVGWPQNPFILMNPQLLSDLLTSITLNAKNIEMTLELSSPLRHVIIDTNYHFCNIFAQDVENDCYKTYKDNNTLQGEEINIWFLWVYRQLEKLLDDSNEAMTIRNTATTIENILTGSYGSESPLIHVFTPTGLMTTPQKNKGILSALFNAQRNDKDHIIPQFEKLANKDSIMERSGIKFEEWLKILNSSYNNVVDKQNSGRAELFPEVLLEAIEKMDHQRPKNIIPISVYQSNLKHYTDKERSDAIARLRNMKIYNRLSTLLK